jgi:hypothetical protein
MLPQETGAPDGIRPVPYTVYFLLLVATLGVSLVVTHLLLKHYLPFLFEGRGWGRRGRLSAGEYFSALIAGVATCPAAIWGERRLLRREQATTPWPFEDTSLLGAGPHDGHHDGRL